MIPARKDAARRPAGTAPIVELILAKAPDSDRWYLEQALRREMGKAKILFRNVEPTAPEPAPNSGPVSSFTPAQLARAIRAAVERGVSGLIVEPREDPAVVDALHQARGRGVAVLLLDRPVAPRGGPPIPYIRYAPFADPGRQIVQAALEAAKLLGPKGLGRILILHHRLGDPYETERLESLADPLEAAGKPFDEIPFEGDFEQASAALTAALDQDPKVPVAIVLADADQGIAACFRVLSQRRKASRSEFLYGGYHSYDVRTATDQLRQAVAFADRSVESFATKTFQTMRRLLDGQAVGERVEIPITVHKQTTIFVPKSRVP